MSDHEHDFQPDPKSGIRICTFPNCCQVDRARHRTSEPEARGAGPHCQLCGGKVEGWTCQTCEASFEEVDGLLVLKSEAAHPAPASADKLRVAVEALERIKGLLSLASQDLVADAVAQNNRSLAWHSADTALAALNEGGK